MVSSGPPCAMHFTLACCPTCRVSFVGVHSMNTNSKKNEKKKELSLDND